MYASPDLPEGAEAQRRLLASVLNHAPAGIAVLDGRDLRARWANPAYCQFLEEPYRSNGIAGARLQDFVPLAEQSGLVELFRRVAATGHPHTDPEYEHVGFERGVTYWRWSLAPLPVEGRDCPDLMIMASEVTEHVRERRQTEALAESLQAANVELARNERLLDAILDNIVAQVAYLDRDMRFVRVNQAYADGCGHPMEELIGRGHFELFPNEENEAIFAGVRDTSEPYIARAKPFAFAGQPERGVTYWDWWLRPIRGASGEDEGVVLSLVDVTAVERARREVERLNEQLRTADRRKDEFVAMLAHELRNPLAAISSAVRLMQARRPADRGLHRAPDAAARQAQHMARLLDDLLDVSRITEGKITLKKEQVALAEATQTAIESVHPLIEARGHELSVSLPQEALFLDADPVRVAQVVANLLHNAAKYTPPGGEISLLVRREGDQAAIRVRDNGIGIAPDLLPHVFDLFVQAERTPDRAHGGLGIGLTMVRALAEMHGGRVEALSDGPGKGSEFVVWLPLIAAPQTRAAVTVSKQAPAPTPRRVLVVDDTADAAEMLAGLLELEGHEVRTATSGPEALALVREMCDARCGMRDGCPASPISHPPSHIPHVVLLDIGMPGMDGYEVARRLRADPALAGVVLVALTGYGQDEDIQRSRQAGFDHHLVKPVDIDTLFRILSEAPAG